MSLGESCARSDCTGGCRPDFASISALNEARCKPWCTVPLATRSGVCDARQVADGRWASAVSERMGVDDGVDWIAVKCVDLRAVKGVGLGDGVPAGVAAAAVSFQQQVSPPICRIQLR